MLHVGHEILIDDGLVRLRVESVDRGRARCVVVAGGIVETHKGVNVPGVPVPIPSLTRKDMDDLDFALDLGVDFVALSFVRSAADVRDLRELITASGAHARVIAKIEKAEAVDALDAILVETDAVMVARGDLGVEIGAALVPLIQKRIILASLDRAKPVITATQMLESMIHQLEPTRAEASDVANAILDGSSALMLSGETARGEHPGRGRRLHGPDRARDRAEPRVPAPAAGGERGAHGRAGDVERGLRSRGVARRRGPARADVHGRHGLRRRPAAAAEADHRHVPPRLRVAADGDRVGSDADADPGGGGRRGPLDALGRSRARERAREGRRPRRDHRGNGREPPGHDERDQSRRRLQQSATGHPAPRGLGADEQTVPREHGPRVVTAPMRAGGAPARLPRGRFLLRWLAVAIVGFVAFLYSQPLRSYLSTRDALETGAHRKCAMLRAQKLRLQRRLADADTPRR